MQKVRFRLGKTTTFVANTEPSQQVRQRFSAVGGLEKDFRKSKGSGSADLPSLVRNFESLVEEGKGENGAGVHLSGLEKEKAEELQKTWAFNKIASDKVSFCFCSGFRPNSPLLRSVCGGLCLT